jgi:hypothetical protein
LVEGDAEAMFDDLLQQVSGVQGVARLATCPSFDAPSFLTLAYTPEVVVAAAFAQGVGLWVEFPLAPGGSLSPDAVSRIVPWLSFGVAGFERLAWSPYEPTGHCPELIGSWAALRAAGDAAVGCFAPVCDGVSYSHGLFDRAGSTQATWYNPRLEYGYPAQAELVSAYASLQARAQLTPKLIRQAFGIDETPDPSSTEFEWPAAAGGEAPERPGKKRPKPWRRSSGRMRNR